MGVEGTAAAGRGRAPQISVVGAGEGDAALLPLAEEVGRLLGEAGATLVCGGLGGVMEAACRGARSAGGRTVGLLPGRDRAAANPFVEIGLPTGLGETRNALVAAAGEAMIAIGGGWGSLAEIAWALKAGTPVIGLDTWDLTRGGQPVEAVERATSAAEAVARALELARERGSGSRPGRTAPDP